MLRRPRAGERGAVLVEFTLVVVLLLAVSFALVELGLALFWWTMTEKAAERGLRLAKVRPAVAAGVPEANSRRGGLAPMPRYGTPCRHGTAPCVMVGRQACRVTLAGDTTDCATPELARLIATRMRALSPLALASGSAGEVVFAYEDSGLGFVGGPYVPLVTIEIRGVTFPFLALGPLVRLLGAGAFPDGLPMPAMRSTAVGEDLGAGESG